MDTRENPAVGHLALFVTENCNLRCEYCFASNMIKKNISIENGRKAIDFLFDHSGKRKQLGITLWGGEAFMRFPLMKRLVAHAEKKAKETGKRVTFSVPTNATLLSDRVLDYVREHKIRLSLSIDGMADTQARRKTVAGGNSFPLVEKVLPRVVQKLRDYLPPVRMTVTPSAAANLYRDVNFFLNAGIKNINFFTAPELDWDAKSLKTFKDQQLRLADDFIQRIEEGNLSIQFGSWSSVLRNLYRMHHHPEKAGTLARKSNDKMGHCGFGDTMLAVSVDGEFYPCHRFVFYDRDKKNHLLGNLESGLIREKTEQYGNIYHSDPEVEGRKCMDCDIAFACRTFCGAANYDYSGCTTDIHPNVCKVVKTTYTACTAVFSALKDHENFKKYLQRISQPGAHARAFVIPDPHSDAYEDLLDDLAGEAEGLLKGLHPPS